MDHNTFYQGVPGANASGGPTQQQLEHQQLIQQQLLQQQQLAYQQHVQQLVHQQQGQQQHAPQRAIVGWAARPVAFVTMELRPMFAGEAAPGSPGGGGQQQQLLMPGSAGLAGPPAFGAMAPMSPSRHGSMNLGMGMGLPPLPGAAFGMAMMPTAVPTAVPNGVGVDPNGGVGVGGGGHNNMRHPSQPQLYQFVPYASHPGVANVQAAANGPPTASPLSSTFRFSPSASSFQPYQCGGVIFGPSSSSTLQPQSSAEFAAARDLPPPPAVLPGPAMAYSQTKARAQQHRPHPLSMHTVPSSSSAQDGDRPQEKQPKSGHLQQPKPRHPQHGRNSSLIHSAPAVQRYAVRRAVTPEPSDYGYDGYGSAYSTSPLASECRRKILKHYAQKRAAAPGSSQYDDEEEGSTDGDEDDGPSDGLSGNASSASERRPVAVAKKSLKPSSSESTLVPGRRTASSRWMRRESSMSAGVLVAAGPSRVATVVSDDDPLSSPTPASRAARNPGPARPVVVEHNHHHHNHNHGHRHAHQSQTLSPRGPQPPPRPVSSSDGADRDASSCASSEGWSSSATAGDNDTHGSGCTCGFKRCAQCGMYVSPDKHQCPAGGSQPLQG